MTSPHELFGIRYESISPWDILSDAAIGILTFDHTERLIAANSGFSILYAGMADVTEPGASLHALLSAIATRYERNIPDERREWADKALLSLRGAMPVQHELGTGRICEFTPYATPKGLALFVSDITTIKHSQIALREAKEIADKASQSKSRFLRAASHDLRQPLATLKILIYTCQGILDEIDRMETLRAMDISVGIIEDLLSALLNIGQLDGGNIMPHIDSFPLSAIFERLAIQFSHVADQKGLDLRIMPSSTVIFSDRILLERILSNLVGNALRYTHTGKVLVGCKRTGDSLRILVIDTGPGIEPEHHDRIFEEFYRIGPHFNEAGNGHFSQKSLGLGLNIAQRFAHLIESHIELHSIPGQGSCFAIKVPLGQLWRASVSEQNISEFLSGQFAGLEVLLVEDDQLLREAVTQLLQRWGIVVTAFTEPEEAINSFQTRGTRPDLVISDYRLPGGLKGTQVCTRLRSHFGDSLPCIVVTGDTEAEPLNDITSAGLPFLIKPVTPPQLRVLMHHLLYEPDIPDVI